MQEWHGVMLNFRNNGRYNFRYCSSHVISSVWLEYVTVVRASKISHVLYSVEVIYFVVVLNYKNEHQFTPGRVSSRTIVYLP